jgi:hypothetical protein
VHAIAPQVGERGGDKRGFWKIVVHEAEEGSEGATLPQNRSKAKKLAHTLPPCPGGDYYVWIAFPN